MKMTDHLYLLIRNSTTEQIQYAGMLLIGQLSFAFAAWSFTKKDMLDLRRLQVLSGILGLVFNGYLAFEQESVSWGLITVVFWLAVFLVINVRSERKLSAARMEVALNADDKTLFSDALPLASTRDIKNLVDRAEVLKLADNDVLIARKTQTSQLFMIREGHLMESLPNGERWLLGRAMMLGDLTFLINDSTKGSEGEITADKQATVLAWSYETLRQLCADSETLSAALTDGIARGIAKKRNFLDGAHLFSGQLSKKEPQLSRLERDLHAEVFPDLAASEFKLILDLAQCESINSGQLIELDDELACIKSGQVTVKSTQGSDTVLKQFFLLGEFGFMAADRRNRAHHKIIAVENTTLLVCFRDALEDLEINTPILYINLMKSIARSLVGKITDRNRLQ